MPKDRRALIVILVAWTSIVTVGLGGCGESGEKAGRYSSWVFPGTTHRQRMSWGEDVAAHPKRYRDGKLEEARDLSRRLEQHIRRWVAGKAGGDLADVHLPAGIENEKSKGWRIVGPEAIKPEEQWYFRPAHEIPADYSKLHFLSPDNHCTYLKLLYVAPYGSRLVITGEFPHCRFMDYQITPPFDPATPADGGFGAAEVPIVDVDIDPLPGHVNPFRVGANRAATRRGYRVVFDLREGNAVTLNEVMKEPALRGYRAPGNVRAGGPWFAGGAYTLGQIHTAVVWLRYYAPDKAAGPLGGVPLPKAHLELPSGERYWIRCDFSEAVRVQNLAVKGVFTPPTEPPSYLGPSAGWFKMFGIWRVIADGYGLVLSRPWGYLPTNWAKQKVVAMDEIFFRRGRRMPPPGSYEASATCCNYISYLARPMALGKGKILVLTGRLPLTPATRDGQRTMTRAEARYWSICRYASSPDGEYPMVLYGSLMDDELVLDEQRRYVIVYSRTEDRPRNARPSSGVTWQEWGPPAQQGLTIRWLSVKPEWHLPGRAPDEESLPWARACWSEPGYTKELVGDNRPGVLGPYHPLIHYMAREELEALGDRLSVGRIPPWR